MPCSSLRTYSYPTFTHWLSFFPFPDLHATQIEASEEGRYIKDDTLYLIFTDIKWKRIYLSREESIRANVNVNNKYTGGKQT